MNNPDQIRREIEATRRDLSNDVNNLNDKVNPSRVVERRVEKTRTAVAGVKDKVMGAVPSTSPSEGVDAAKEKISHATSGSPLAAGLIAFGAGWLLSAPLPASEAERRAATAAKEMITEHSDELSGPLHEVAETLKENMQEHVTEAVEAVKDSATDAAATVKNDATHAKDSVMN